MNENFSYNISYDDMKKIIKNYYTQQGREVELKISSEIDTDRFAGQVVTSVQVREKSTIGGVETIASKYLSEEDLREILSTILDQEGKELVDFSNNATVSSKTAGHGIGEHEVQSVSNKSFTIAVKEKRQSFSK